MFRYPKKSKEQIEEMGRFFKEGKGRFELTGGEVTVSKAGAPMLILELMVTDERGKKGLAKDYIVESTDFKILAFLKSIGQEGDFGSGMFDFQKYLDCKGDCLIKYKPSDMGDSLNIIYLHNKHGNGQSVETTDSGFKGATESENPAEPFDDDIPF